MCNTCVKSKRFKDRSCTYKNTGSSHWSAYISLPNSWENFLKDQSIFPYVIILFTLINFFYVLILLGENWCWSLLGLLTMEINVREEITIKWQNYSFLSHKYSSSSISNVINNKNELWKTVRLTSFQKPQLQLLCWSYFLCFTQFGGRSHYLNFDKFRNTAPLKSKLAVGEPNGYPVAWSRISNGVHRKNRKVGAKFEPGPP